MNKEENTLAESSSPKLVPPFTEETAAMKVKAAEALWNTCDAERVALAYTEDAEWRNRDEFLRGRAEIVAFLQRKWHKELDYSLRKTLWTFNENRISVSFEYESRDASGQWYRSYGVELWEFALDGRMRRRIASINDAKIEEADRRLQR
jgi:nuclear transport factor 2 (NTF2) superfamily protein